MVHELKLKVIFKVKDKVMGVIRKAYLAPQGHRSAREGESSLITKSDTVLCAYHATKKAGVRSQH
jgi:hypothetical protein